MTCRNGKGRCTVVFGGTRVTQHDSYFIFEAIKKSPSAATTRVHFSGHPLVLCSNFSTSSNQSLALASGVNAVGMDIACCIDKNAPAPDIHVTQYLLHTRLVLCPRAQLLSGAGGGSSDPAHCRGHRVPREPHDVVQVHSRSLVSQGRRAAQ